MSPREDLTQPLAACDGLFDALLDVALPCVVAALERSPNLVTRLAGLLAGQPAGTPDTGIPFMSVAQYAARKGICERSVRYDLEQMSEGVHYERAGRAGRRVIIRVADADRWYAERQARKSQGRGETQLVVDSVTQFRARAALKKRRIKG